MKRTTLTFLMATAILSGFLITACGGGDDEGSADPRQVVDAALSRQALLGGPPREARVEVASLGYEDRVLEQRSLSVDAPTYTRLKRALSGGGSDEEGSGGLSSLVRDLTSEGRTELGGVEVEQVSGELDVGRLISQLRSASGRNGKLGSSAEGLPGLGRIDQLEETLAGATFDLFAATGDGSLERLDLTLSLDDPENALPPTRIRFSLTESDPNEVPS